MFYDNRSSGLTAATVIENAIYIGFAGCGAITPVNMRYGYI